MTQSYSGWCSLQATVPENPDLEPLLKCFVEFPIICARCGPKHSNLKKNGHDYHHHAQVQVFYCKTCGHSCYAHTSWLFDQLKEILLERILKQVLLHKTPPQVIKKEYQIAQSTLSTIFHQCQTVVQQKLHNLQIRQAKVTNLSKQTTQPITEIWMDETFFRIEGQSWALLLLVSRKGEILNWNLSKTRTAQDYLELIRPLMRQLGKLPVFIGDGWKAYEKMCQALQRRCILVQHLHTHPWDEVRLHHFEFDEDSQKGQQITISLPYSAFLQTQRVDAYFLERTYKKHAVSTVTRKRGRPKGRKDTKKRQKRGSGTNSKSKSRRKKRGAKTPRTHGELFSFDPRTAPQDWQLKLHSRVLRGKAFHFPLRTQLTHLLKKVYRKMDGKNIVSNYIESVNHVLKLNVSTIGLKKHVHLEKRLNYFFQGNFSMRNKPPVAASLSSNLSASKGFVNLLKFFHPRMNQIELQGGIF